MVGIKLLALTVICCVVFEVANGYSILDVPRLCRPTDQRCLSRTATEVLHSLACPKGRCKAPSWCVDPFLIERISINQHPNACVSLDQNYYDMRFKGLSHGYVNNFVVKLNETHCNLRFDIFMHKFIMESIYKWVGNVWDTRIDGLGECEIVSHDVVHTHDLLFRLDADGRLFIQSYTMKLKPSKITFDMPNLVKGDTKASRRAETLLNDKWQDIFKALEPDYERCFPKCFLHWIRNFFDGLTIADLFKLTKS